MAYLCNCYSVLGSSPGLFGNDGLASRGYVGYSFLACENGMILNNGYLIGWQYYLVTASNQCSNSSYATIYRKGSDNRYAEIASTQLQPVLPNKNGINFQFVQKALIAVRVGDVIGTYTLGCDSIHPSGRTLCLLGRKVAKQIDLVVCSGMVILLLPLVKPRHSH